MARRPSALGKKALGLTDARRHARELLGSVLRGFGLGGRNRVLRYSDRAMREQSQQPCGPSHADPRAAASAPARAAGVIGAIPRPGVKNRARAIRIEHWIRHAHPKSDSSVPFDKNLPMGMSAESIE
jgi:hypothetical protein